MRDMLKAYVPVVYLCLMIGFAMYEGNRVGADVLGLMLVIMILSSANMHEVIAEQKQLRARIFELEALTLENGSAQDQGQSN